MTLAEAASKLFAYYKKRGFIGTHTWVQSIGVRDSSILVFVRDLNYDYRKCKKELLKEGTRREFVWNGYPVEFKYVGEIVSV